MRILHVGWGFSPWRRGGLIYYAEDLMRAQVERGHAVGYFFSGRHYPRISGPRMRRWRLAGVEMHEVVNAPMVSGLELGTRAPELELSEPRVEAGFRRVLESFRPDVVHVQELLCLPSSLIDVARHAGVATVMTLQDYFPLCATLRLVDADGQLCTRLQVGEDCMARNADAPSTTAPFIADTLWYEIPVWRRRLRLGGARFDSWFEGERIERLFEWATSHGVPVPDSADPAAYQRRRDVNVERLGRVGGLVAQSPRVAEVYAARGVSPDRMTTLRFTLAHIERLRPRELSSPPEPITFATLGGCASPTKGSEVVRGALHRLRETDFEGRFRLLVLGGVHDNVRADLEAFEGVDIGELYERSELDALLDRVDVGIMPSTWEEAFGYSGVEMLAKGIPLIANPLGGIAEYALEGETAWLNRSGSAQGLADAMTTLIEEPGQVVEMNERVRAARARVVVPMARHLDAIEKVYADA